MAPGPVVAVLSPITGGFYFGGILTGIAREVAAARGRVVLVQTLDAGLSGDEVLGAPDFRTPTALDVADGFVALAASTGPAHLERLRAAGRPVVLAGHRAAGLDVRSAMPDNAGGVHAAVDHLVRVHGHRRIGFVGNLAQADMQERAAAFAAAARAHGLDPAGTPHLAAPDNAETGGRAALAALLAQDPALTAVVAATDRNALGLVAAAQEAGLRVPGDLAVVGFDDVERWSAASPLLTTVDQSFERVGALAARLLLAELRGEAVPPGRSTSPAGLVLRTSCGCDGSGRGAEQEDGGGHEAPGTRTEARRALAGALRSALRPDPEVPADAAAVGELADVLDGALLDTAAAPADVAARQRRAADLLRALDPSAEALRQLTAAVAHHVAATLSLVAPETSTPAGAALRRRLVERHSGTVSALWAVHADGLLARSAAQQATIAEQYAVSMSLLDRDDGDPRSLGWLGTTHVEVGCLALWDGPGPDHGAQDHGAHDHGDGGAALRVVGVHDRCGDLRTGLGAWSATARAFPPAALLERADPAREEVVYAVPVRARGRDWGLLGVVGRIDARSVDARATYNHWAALLTVAFEQERLLAALRTSEEHLRRRALHDAVTGLPNRTLFLERLGRALEREAHAGREFAVLFLDLDGFKQVNDTLGHDAGDRLLVTVAERLAGAVRAGDTAARFGGDEFAVLLEAPADEAVRVVERMQRAIAEPVELDGTTAHVSASVGIAVRPRGAGTAEQVLRDADRAMYRAKSTRRGSWILDDGGARVRYGRGTP